MVKFNVTKTMFVYKTPAEFEALSEYQREKYLDQKAQHEKEQAKEIADKAAKDAVEEALKDVESKIEDAKKSAKEEALQEAKDELKAKEEAIEAKFEAMEKAWNSRGGITNRAEKAQTMSDYIMAKFSTEEGEALLKDFANGNKKGFHASIDVEKASFLTPANSVAADFRPIVGGDKRRIHARNVVPTFPTVSNLISFLRLTPDADADGITLVAEGAAKGEMEFDPEVVQVPVQKIAGFITFSDESLDDVVGLRAWLASELPEAYLRVEDEYIFNDATYGINTLASAWVDDGAINSWDTLISAIAQVENLDNYVNAIFVSPDGKKELLRNKDLINGLYTYPMPSGQTGLSLDGIPIYSSSIFEGLEFLAGDFSASAVTYHLRKDMQIKYSEEHASNFTTNLVTVLIEGRGAIAVRKPYAFVKGELVVNTITT